MVEIIKMIDNKRKIMGFILIFIIISLLIVLIIFKDIMFKKIETRTYYSNCSETYINNKLITPMCIETELAHMTENETDELKWLKNINISLI